MSKASKGYIDWMEYETEKRNLHIHHARCGHGGERWIVGGPVDDYEPTTKTVFQYHGCHFHGCPAHCKQGNARVLLRKTQQQDQKIRDAGYNLVVVWECKAPGYKAIAHKQKTEIYIHMLLCTTMRLILTNLKAIGQQKTSHTKMCTYKFQFL